MPDQREIYRRHTEQYERLVSREDYQDNIPEAQALIDFFFGAELARQVVERQWVTLPECMGVWWQRL
jgi:hypothetical protein